MLVETLKWRNSKVLAIFTGKQYIFTNEYDGILAVATRKGFGKDEENSFTLEYGNKHTRFQFHKGTIRTGYRANYTPHPRFISIP